MKLNLHFSFQAINDEGHIEREDAVNRELEFDNNTPPTGFIARMESFFQELLFAYVPDYPFHKAAKVTRLDVKPTDWVIIEYELGAVATQDLEEISKTFRKAVSRCELIGLKPGRNDLKFTVIGKERP